MTHRSRRAASSTPGELVDPLLVQRDLPGEKGTSGTSSFRRIVMDETTAGASSFREVDTIELRHDLSDGAPIVSEVWGWNGPASVPACLASPYRAMGAVPPPGGVRVLTLSYPPGWEPARNPPGESKGGPFSYYDSEIPGMHSTDTIDVGVVIAGSLLTIASDGTREVLQPGDVYVQNGAPHAWGPAGDEPCTMVVVLVGAERFYGAGDARRQDA